MQYFVTLINGENSCNINKFGKFAVFGKSQHGSLEIGKTLTVSLFH